MSRLDTLLQELCPDGVEFRPLEQCCVILDNKRKPVTKGAREEGEYPYYGANGIQDYVSGYIFDGTFVLVGEDGSVVTPNGNPVVTWAEGKIWVNNHAHIIAEKDGILLRYLFHYIQTINVKPLIHGNIPKLTGGDFKALEIPVPPLEVQREIVRILDKFTQLKAELSEELSTRRIQYEHYRDRLLTFGDDVPLKSIGEICSVSAGGDAPKDAMSKEKEEGFEIPIVSNGIGDNALYGYTNIAKITEPAVTVAARGTIGYAEYRDYPYYPIIRLLTVMPKNNKEVHTKYLYYCLAGKEYSIPQGGIPQLTAPMLKKELIPIPSIDKQKEIIRILDRFNCLTTDIYSGIPAEIEARTKQYEFYRDKLLSFKRKEAS